MIINDLSISLMMLVGIRFLAAVLFLILFIKRRKVSYFLLLMGWIVYLIGPVPDLLTFTYPKETLLPVFPFTAAFATILIMFGILMYIRKVDTTAVIATAVLLGAVLSILFYFFPPLGAVSATLVQGAFLLYILLMVVFHRKLFKESQSGVSFLMLCLTLLLGLVHAIGFNFIYQNSLLSLRFLFTGLINLSILIFLIYFDWEQIQKSLNKSLNEKELLLQEVHHRVKNNLAIISSILRLQQYKNKDPEKNELLFSVENRINTMALVHEQLYESKDFKHIDISVFISDLIHNISACYSMDNNKIMITKEIEPVTFTFDKLIPLGMIINEILTNTFKYAFSNTDSPEITISLNSISGGKYMLIIKDNGKGFSEEILKDGEKSTGFTIIDALSQQLNAKLSVKTEHGTEFKIKIPG